MGNKALFAFIMISVLLLAGCATDTTTSKKKVSEPDYTGFMELKAGQWTEMVSKGVSGKVTTRTEVLEHSPSLSKIQVTTGEGAGTVIAQIWIDMQSGEASKYVVKAGGKVSCHDASGVPDDYVPSDGKQFDPDVRFTYDIYNTPTGKDVAVAKFSSASGETWVSSEVPFGIVKVMMEGETVSSLYDFGTIGARSSISDDELEGCDDGLSAFALPAQEGYDEAGSEAEADGPEPLPAEEETLADEEEEGSATVETEVKAMGTGQQQVVFACADCEAMPPAAKSACLAACE